MQIGRARAAALLLGRDRELCWSGAVAGALVFSKEASDNLPVPSRYAARCLPKMLVWHCESGNHAGNGRGRVSQTPPTRSSSPTAAVSVSVFEAAPGIVGRLTRASGSPDHDSRRQAATSVEQRGRESRARFTTDRHGGQVSENTSP